MMMIAAMFEVCSEDGLRLCTERNNSSSTQGKAKKPINIVHNCNSSAIQNYISRPSSQNPEAHYRLRVEIK